MSEANHETIADIVAEMRNNGWERCQLGWTENKSLFDGRSERSE